MGHIYKLTAPSGRIYIGQSVNYKARFRYYSNNADKVAGKLKTAMIKYGWNELEKEIVTECCNCMLNVLEKFYISQYDSFASGMNCTDGGDSFKLSEESKNLIRLSRIGSKMPKTSGDKHWTRRTGRSIVPKGYKMPSAQKLKNAITSSKLKTWLYDKDTMLLLCWFDTGYTFSLTTGLSAKLLRKKPTLIADKYIAIRSADDQPNKINYTPFSGTNVRWSRKVNQLNERGEFIKEWGCMKDAGAALSINYKNIQSVCAGSRRIAGGFLWEYKPDTK